MATTSVWAGTDPEDSNANRISQNDTIVMARGQESIVTEINMGPDATSLWRKIHRLAKSGKIRDFKEISEEFNLELAGPINAITQESAIGSELTDIKSRDGLIVSGIYGLFISSGQPRKRFLTFEATFDTNYICLSEYEIQRVLGKGL